MTLDYAEMVNTIRKAAMTMKPRSPSGSLRRTMRLLLKGPRYRVARKAIKRILDSHERWSAEGYAALYPWSSGFDAYFDHGSPVAWKRLADPSPGGAEGGRVGG